MLYLSDIAKHIKSKIPTIKKISAGVIDASANESVGVFDNNRSKSIRIALGGAENTRYYKQQITILVHWGKTQKEALTKAMEIYKLFFGVSDVTISGNHIAFFVAFEPQSIGFTQDKIYEYIIPVDIYINKEE